MNLMKLISMIFLIWTDISHFLRKEVALGFLFDEEEIRNDEYSILYEIESDPFSIDYASIADIAEHYCEREILLGDTLNKFRSSAYFFWMFVRRKSVWKAFELRSGRWPPGTRGIITISGSHPDQPSVDHASIERMARIRPANSKRMVSNVGWLPSGYIMICILS